MEVIPVLDVLGGVAVHARGGDRAAYRPVRSGLADGADPRVLARAYRERLGAQSCYVADLDAIAGAPPNLDLVRAIAAEGLRLWVDAGIRDAATARALLDAGARHTVVGLETLPGLDTLTEIVDAVGVGAPLFSLDVRGDRVLAGSSALAAQHPVDLAARARERGVRAILVLDLRRVGAEEGPPLPLAAAVRARFPDVFLAVGGGLRNANDLERCASAGLDAALIATALHRGRLTRADLREQAGR